MAMAQGAEHSVETAVLSNVRVSRPPKNTKTLSHSDLKHEVQNAPDEIVPGLIPDGSVNIVVGDSGLGKTPLLGQLAVCVATGKPFLGLPVRRGTVLWVDYENGLAPLGEMFDALAAHLALHEVPEELRILSQPSSRVEVEREIEIVRPSLVIVDALRGYEPKAEKDNTAAGELLSKCQKICSVQRAAMLFIHHIRKPDIENPQRLASADSALSWLLQASGARALINQTFVRIGIDQCSTPPAELVLRAHYKLRGEVGPWQLARKYDETGEPTGYYRLTGIALLNQDQHDAFVRLPEEFTFTEAERVYGKRGGNPTTKFLNHCLAVGVLEKHGQHKRTRYRKVEPTTPRSEGSEG
jgi:AAA domain